MLQGISHSNNFFTWKDIKIYQDDLVFKVGTDALLLGNWVPKVIQTPSCILDVGTGSGILSLLMAYHFSYSKIYAIDIDEQAVRLAAFNTEHSNFGERIFVSQENILEKDLSIDLAFDLVLSNPPFYTTQILPQEDYSIRAKHSLVPISQWMKSLITRTTPTGQVCIIIPGYAAMEWIRAANQLGYYNLDRMDVYSFFSDPSPKRTMLSFVRKLQKPRFSRMAIYTTDHGYTHDYLDMTGIQSKQHHRLRAGI